MKIIFVINYNFNLNILASLIMYTYNSLYIIFNKIFFMRIIILNFLKIQINNFFKVNY